MNAEGVNTINFVAQNDERTMRIYDANDAEGQDGKNRKKRNKKRAVSLTSLSFCIIFQAMHDAHE